VRFRLAVPQAIRDDGWIYRCTRGLFRLRTVEVTFPRWIRPLLTQLPNGRYADFLTGDVGSCEKPLDRHLVVGFPIAFDLVDVAG